MKLVLLLGVLLVGAYAQSTNWDLSSVQAADASLDWTKSAAVDRSNQGYTARYTHQGKLLKLSLPVHKERDVRVTDTDRLLFGIESISAEHEIAMANTTMSRKDTASLCERALGSEWNAMVQLPVEDLTYLESLRLAASLNEYNLLASGSPTHKSKRSSSEHEHEFPSSWDCACHSTNHRFPWSGHDGVYWGVRLLQKNTAHIHARHDCLLCDHTTVTGDDTAQGFEYDCRWCCYGECVTGLATNSGMSSLGDWTLCDTEFEFDYYRANRTDSTYNYYKLNDVGSCRLPRVYHCVPEVHRYCSTCTQFIQTIMADSDGDSDFLNEFESCRYCELVVGANRHICPDCPASLEAVDTYGSTTGFREQSVGESDCNCRVAMAHVTGEHDGDEHHEGDRHEDSHEGDHYESHDYNYDYNRNDYDYDYNRNDYGYDYGRNDYDYSRNDYDYGYESHEESHEGDHYESHEYDYGRNDYDYGYESHEDNYESHDYDYGRNDYDYSRNDYDYGRNDYDYGYESHEDNYESHDYDYGRNDYGYDYGRNDYDYNRNDYGYDYGREEGREEGDYHEQHEYQAAHESHEYVQDHFYPTENGYRDYDYRTDYDFDYRNDYDFDFRIGGNFDYSEGDHHESHEGDHYESNDYDYDYRRPSDYDYRYESHESHEGDHYESNDYDYSRNDYGYDYGRNDYDYNYRG